MLSPKLLFERIRQWLGNETGVISVELIFVVPIIVSLSMIFTDAGILFRKQVVTEPAALTVTDLLSRELYYVNDNYIDGVAGLTRFLTGTNKDPGIRITTLRWVNPDTSDPLIGEYRVSWTERRNTDKAEMTNAMLNDMSSGLPFMANSDRLILVETFTQIVPSGLFMKDAFDYKTWNFVYPRFAKQVCFNNTPDNPDTAKC